MTATTLKAYDVRMERGRARITRLVAALTADEARALASHLFSVDGDTGWAPVACKRSTYAFNRGHKVERHQWKRAQA